MPLSTAAWIALAAGTVISAGTAAYGAYSQGQAQEASAKYNAQVAANNAVIAQQQAVRAAQAGEAQAEVTQQKTRAKLGGIVTSEAAGNIDVNSGSSLDVQSSAKQLGELDALTVRSNAAQTAYGYETQSAADTAQSQLDKSQASNSATAGDIGAGGSILGGVSSAASNYNNYQLQNSLASSLNGNGGAVGNAEAALWVNQ